VTSLTLQGLTKTFDRAGTVIDNIDLRIEQGEFFTLLGPSGCGKSTALRIIAGLEEPTGGRIFFGDRDVTYEPANRRGIGFVFQNYALFPHMTVSDNVAFGLKIRKMSRAQITKAVEAALDQVALGGLGGERVDRLSGGQQQRVALARALVIRPTMLLLDEPLSNLDAKLRDETRATLRSLHRSSGATTIYVTHDQSEALAMSDRIAVMNKGRIHQSATPEEIYQRPSTRFVADFIGRNNVLDGVISDFSDNSAVVTFTDGTSLTIRSTQKAEDVVLGHGERVAVCLRSEIFRLDPSGLFTGVVEEVEYSGPVQSYRITTGAGTLFVEMPSSAARLSPGHQVRLGLDASAVHLVRPA